MKRDVSSASTASVHDTLYLMSTAYPCTNTVGTPCYVHKPSMQQGLLELGCHDVPSDYGSLGFMPGRRCARRTLQGRSLSQAEDAEGAEHAVHGSAKAAADIWNVHSAQARPVLPPQARPTELSNPGPVQFEESAPFCAYSSGGCDMFASRRRKCDSARQFSHIRHIS